MTAMSPRSKNPKDFTDLYLNLINMHMYRNSMEEEN
jgi:hypothetical protein